MEVYYTVHDPVLVRISQMDHDNVPVSQILTILYKLGHDGAIEFLHCIINSDLTPQYVNKGHRNDEVVGRLGLSEETFLYSEYLH